MPVRASSADIAAIIACERGKRLMSAGGVADAGWFLITRYAMPPLLPQLSAGWLLA